MALIAYGAGLVVIWVLAWGSPSVANVLGGVAVAVVLLAVAPDTWPGLGRPRIRPAAIARFLAYTLVKIVESNVVLTREVLSARTRIHTGVIAVPLPECSDALLALITNVMALTPGTMPLEVGRQPTVIYVHVLHLHDVEEARREMQHLAALAYRAFGSDAAVAALDDPFPRPAGDASGPPADGPGGDVVIIVVTYVVLGVAFLLFAYRLGRGPTLADRVLAVDGLLVAGISTLIVNAMDTGRGAFLQVAVMLTLVGFISTAVIARFIEGAGRVSTVGSVVALSGAILTLLAAVGVVRFPDVLSRMHALTKASTVGFGLVALGAALSLDTANDITSALLAAGLQILTLPVGANLISRSTYLAEGIPHHLDAVDELAQARRRAEPGAAGEQPPPAAGPGDGRSGA